LPAGSGTEACLLNHFCVFLAQKIVSVGVTAPLLSKIFDWQRALLFIYYPQAGLLKHYLQVYGSKDCLCWWYSDNRMTKKYKTLTGVDLELPVCFYNCRWGMPLSWGTVTNSVVMIVLACWMV